MTDIFGIVYAWFTLTTSTILFQLTIFIYAVEYDIVDNKRYMTKSIRKVNFIK